MYQFIGLLCKKSNYNDPEKAMESAIAITMEELCKICVGHLELSDENNKKEKSLNLTIIKPIFSATKHLLNIRKNEIEKALKETDVDIVKSNLKQAIKDINIVIKQLDTY